MSTKLGFLWMLLNEGLGKVASFLAQIALGWLLTREDFGLFALSNSVAAITAIIRNGGIQQVLVQRGDEYDRLASVALKFAFLFNGLTCLVLIAIGPLASEVYGEPDLTLMLATIAISVPLVTPSVIFRAKLSVDHRFRTIANIGIVSAWLRQGLTVLLAYCGFSALSFVLPLIVESSYTSLAGWWAVGRWPARVALGREQFRQLFSVTRWIMLGTLAAALTQQGDYFVIGLFENTAVLGVYFFALQFTVAVSAPFVSSIEAVLLPSLARHSSSEELSAMFFRSIRGICYLALPVAIAVAVFAEPAIALFWQGRWDEAIAPVQWLAASIPASLLLSVSRALLEARGQWRMRSLLLIVHGGLGLTVAGVAAYLGDLLDIAMAVAGYRLAFGAVQLIIVAWSLPANFSRLARAVLQPTLFFGVSVALGWMVRYEYLPACQPVIAALVTYGVFLVAALLLGATAFNRQGRDLLLYILPMVNRRRA